MAKMTLSGISSAMASYVAAAKIAGSWTKTTDNMAGLIDKIGKLVTIDGLFNDKLKMLDGDVLPLGKTIEEYFLDLTLPTTYADATTEGAKDVEPALPTAESVFYSYTLGRQKIKTTVPYNNYERAMLTEQDAGNFGAKILERLQNSYDLARYAEKKQLIGRFADAVYGVNKKVMDKPTDTETGEAFIKQLKADVEEASFPNEKSLTSGAVIGAAPELVLFIKKGIIPSLEVDTYAGAFNRADLAVPCKIVVVDDFGTMTHGGVYALLCDPRGLRLHSTYNVTRSKENADGDFVNFVKHYEDTAFYSKYVYGKVYSAT